MSAANTAASTPAPAATLTVLNIAQQTLLKLAYTWEITLLVHESANHADVVRARKAFVDAVVVAIAGAAFTQRIGWQIRCDQPDGTPGRWHNAEAYQIRCHLQRPDPTLQFRPIYAGGIAEPVLIEVEQETRP